MVGSTNFVRLVYDGDLSDSAPPPGGAPDGSGQIEGVFADYFRSQKLKHDPTAFDGRSDYGPFIANGVPAGGLFTGAEGINLPSGRRLRRNGGSAVRPVLPPGVRHAPEPEQHGARPDVRRRGARRLDARQLGERADDRPVGDDRHAGAEIQGPVPGPLTPAYGNEHSGRMSSMADECRCKAPIRVRR